MNKKHPAAKKVAEVKMTKTARMRLLKANPLIKYQIEKTNEDIAKHLNLDTVSVMNRTLVNELKTEALKNDNNISVRKTNNKETKLTKQAPRTQKGNVVSKHVAVKQSTYTEKVVGKSVRRSMSAPGLKSTMKSEGKISMVPEESEIINRSISVENVTTISNSKESNSHTSYYDQAISSRPSSHRKSVFISTPGAPIDLGRRLVDWLEKKKKKVSAFKHLKCFGVHKITLVEEENKENFETSCIDRVGSYEALKIDNPLLNDKEDKNTTLAFAPSDLEKVAGEAIKDLNCLMTEGYPVEQCEAWLKVIRNKCPHIVESPQYWECRATIEQLRGDIGSAVECYKTAVVQGAEVTSVEQSLDQLLQKFKLLDIDSSTDQKPPKERVRVMQDFKNVFTSTIIKFAIQEKNLKKTKNKLTNDIDSSNKFHVTPVRRSTRVSRSLYSSTPGTKLCSTLEELDPEEKQRMIFKPNTALYDV